MNLYTEKLFPLINDLITRQFVRHRKKVLRDAHGRMLEIGFGSGLSLECYPEAVTEIVGLEPNAGMVKRAESRLGGRARLVEGVAEKLPFSDQEFDGVVSFLTLCSVADLTAAVREIRRVLKPGGKLFFIEHTAQPPHSVTRALQQKVQPVWGHVACGCHVDRETLSALERADFQLSEVKSLGYSGFPNILGPVYRGVATAPR